MTGATHNGLARMLSFRGDFTLPVFFLHGVTSRAAFHNLCQTTFHDDNCHDNPKHYSMRG